MADFDDFERTGVPVELEARARDTRVKWAAIAALALLAVALVGYIVIRRNASPAPQTRAESSVQSASDVLLPSEIVTTLPPLSETDQIVREMVRRLSSHPKVLAWLATDHLLENFAVVTLNISESQNPNRHLRALAPKGPFRVTRSGGGIVQPDPRSYERYDDYAAAVAGLDAAGTAQLYASLKPRIIDAYKELGHPEGDFDPVLERAIAQLTNVPPIEHKVVLQETLGFYQFADGTLEALSPAQKQLLRMGPGNMRLIQEKLREIAARLDFATQ